MCYIRGVDHSVCHLGKKRCRLMSSVRNAVTGTVCVSYKRFVAFFWENTPCSTISLIGVFVSWCLTDRCTFEGRVCLHVVHLMYHHAHVKIGKPCLSGKGWPPLSIPLHPSLLLNKWVCILIKVLVPAFCPPLSPPSD